MATSKTRADYGQLAQIAQRFASEAESTQQMLADMRAIMNLLEGGDWVGQGANAFFAEMNGAVLPSLTRLTRALADAQRVTIQISREVKVAEDAAAAVLHADGAPDGQAATLASPGGAAPAPVATPLADLGTADGTSITHDLKEIVNVLAEVRSLSPLLASTALAFGIQAGASYAGQLLIHAPEWAKKLGLAQFLRSEAGLTETLSHIKASNLASHMAGNLSKIDKITKGLAVAQAVIAVGDTWVQHWQAYQGYGSGTKQASAMTVDAGLALVPVGTGLAGGVLGAEGGVYAGAAIGTFICPVVGTAIGGLLGGAIGGLGGSYLGDKAGSWVSDTIVNSGWRDAAITWTDRNIAQPVAGAATATVNFLDHTVAKPVTDFFGGAAHALGPVFG